MKSLVLSILLSFIFINGKCQITNGDYNDTITFDDPSGLSHILIDTISNPNNIWQIGHPQKSIFQEVLSWPNAMVTDTINPYPVNDTSSFTYWNVFNGNALFLAGYFWVNSDSLNDFGTIEFSPDNGKTWIDMINDTVFSYYISWFSESGLSGNSGEWTFFEAFIDTWNLWVFNIEWGDTVRYKFSFISDSIFDDKDGLMFEDLYFTDFIVYVPELINLTPSICFPNPASDQIIIAIGATVNRGKIQIFSLEGQLMSETEMNSYENVTFGIGSFPPGIYTYRYINSSGEQAATGQFVKRE